MNKKIYCAGPISGDTTYQENYKKIIELVRQNGFHPLYEPELKPNYVLTDQEIYRRDINWLTDAIGMIAEVSGPSLGVGFEIAYALFELKKTRSCFISRECTKTFCNDQRMRLFFTFCSKI